MQGIKNLTTGSINTQLLKLAMPIMATCFIQMAYSLTDMAWVGRLGSEAIAAVGAVGMLSWMCFSIFQMNKVGAEIGVGQAVGRQDPEQARGYASHNTMMSMIIGVLMAVLLGVLAYPVLRLFHLEENITWQAVSYLQIVSKAYPFAALSLAFTGIYNGAGRSKTPFYINSVGLLMNMVLDPLFIFVFELGVEGAAYATLFSQLLVCIIFVVRIRAYDCILGGFSFFIWLKKAYTFRIVKLGLPVAALNVLFSFVNLFLSGMAAQYGGHIGLMTFTTGGQIEAISWNTAQGFSTALSTFVAQNYAASMWQRVQLARLVALRISVIIGVFSTLLFFFFGNEVFALFVPEQEAYTAGGLFLKIDSYSQIFMMMEITMQGFFYGVGRTFIPATVSICGNYARIPLAFWLVSLGMGVSGIWWAVCITTVLKGVILMVCYPLFKKRIFFREFSTSAVSAAEQ